MRFQAALNNTFCLTPPSPIHPQLKYSKLQKFLYPTVLYPISLPPPPLSRPIGFSQKIHYISI